MLRRFVWFLVVASCCFASNALGQRASLTVGTATAQAQAGQRSTVICKFPLEWMPLRIFR